MDERAFIYYAKSREAGGHQQTNREHLQKVSSLAKQYGMEIGRADEARLCGLLHDFGKYSRNFQDVLRGTRTGVDHAIGGAAFLYMSSGREKLPYLAAIEAICGHHDGLVNYEDIKSNIKQSLHGPVTCLSGKEASLAGAEEYMQAMAAFSRDFPDFSIPQLSHPSVGEGNAVSMLHTRFLLSCLVDADYSASAGILEREPHPLNPEELLVRLEAYRQEIKNGSQSDPELNRLRDQVYDRCGSAGEEHSPGIFTLTAPTGVGKTLALLHFALRHCMRYHKRRILLVLPFLTLTEQSERVYRNILPEILPDHSQSSLTDEQRELAARWDAPFIITTSVKFFESLFARLPTDCRKLHSMADSVILFDEAQSLPAELTRATLQAINVLCGSYGCTMVFSTATQPNFGAIPQLDWHCTEILPEHRLFYQALRRTEVNWQVEEPVPLEKIAHDMARQESVCAVVNLRRHAGALYRALEPLCEEGSVFYLTTDLCPAHRGHMIDTIRGRLKAHLPCRVVSTQCIEAGVDLDFAAVYRALAPLEAIIQAAGRCNRNGTLPHPGSVTVFVPEDSGKIYPGDWYGTGALTVKNMLANGAADIHDPECISEYYMRLYGHLKEKEALSKGLKERDYEQVEDAYKLIPQQGVRVIVPYRGEEKLYREIAGQAHTEGITAALMRKAAPITVSVFDEQALKIHGEALPFRRGRSEPSASGYYLLLTGHEDCYTENMGLQFRESSPDDFMA